MRHPLLAAPLVALVGGLLVASATGTAVRPLSAEAQWIDRVSAICHRYGQQLAQVPAPATVSNAAVLGLLAGRALPLLARQAREVRQLAVPAALRAQVDGLLNDDNGAILALRRIRVAARKDDLRGAQRAFVVFLAAQSSARARSQALGIRC